MRKSLETKPKKINRDDVGDGSLMSMVSDLSPEITINEGTPKERKHRVIHKKEKVSLESVQQTLQNAREVVEEAIENIGEDYEQELKNRLEEVKSLEQKILDKQVRIEELEQEGKELDHKKKEIDDRHRLAIKRMEKYQKALEEHTCAKFYSFKDLLEEADGFKQKTLLLIDSLKLYDSKVLELLAEKRARRDHEAAHQIENKISDEMYACLLEIQKNDANIVLEKSSLRRTTNKMNKLIKEGEMHDAKQKRLYSQVQAATVADFSHN